MCSAGGSSDVGTVGACGLIRSEGEKMPNHICVSSSVKLISSPEGEKRDSDPGSFRIPVTGVEKIRVGSRGPGGQNKKPSPTCSAVEVPKMDFPRTGVPGSRVSPSLRDSERRRGSSGCTAAAPAPAEPSRCPRAPALTPRAPRSSCHASSSAAAQQPTPPGAVPSRAPSLQRRGPGGRRGLAGSVPACGARGRGCSAGAGAGAGAGMQGPGRAGQRRPPRGRPSPDDTAARPSPRPARPRPRPGPPAPGCRSGEAPVPAHHASLPRSRCLQGSGLCLLLHLLPALLIFFPPRGPLCCCFPFIPATHGLSLHSSPGSPGSIGGGGGGGRHRGTAAPVRASPS